jgi:hypothetical protein
MRILAPILTVLALSAAPGPASGQSVFDLFQSMMEGGGWIRIPIEAGRGTYLSLPLPTVGLTLKGCMQIYAGHSGQWDILVRDNLGDGTLEVSVAAGESIPFDYRTGPTAQLSVDARWSEARDTTLVVWIGLEAPGIDRDACEPIYRG